MKAVLEHMLHKPWTIGDNVLVSSRCIAWLEDGEVLCKHLSEHVFQIFLLRPVEVSKFYPPIGQMGTDPLLLTKTVFIAGQAPLRSIRRQEFLSPNLHDLIDSPRVENGFWISGRGR